jgi:hypothetical protein
VARSLTDPLFLIQVVAMIVMILGLIHVVFGQVQTKQDIRQIKGYLEGMR